MEPIKKDNAKIEEIKDIEKNGLKELSEAELEGVEGGGTLFEEFAKKRELLPEELEGVAGVTRLDIYQS